MCVYVKIDILLHFKMYSLFLNYISIMYKKKNVGSVGKKVT